MSNKVTTPQVSALFVCWKFLLAAINCNRIDTIPTTIVSACVTRCRPSFGRINSGMIRRDNINPAPRRWGMMALPIP